MGDRLALPRALSEQPPAAADPGATLRAFKDLFDATHSSVYRYALLLLGDSARAEDLVAGVFADAWRAHDRLIADPAALRWLLTATHAAAQASHESRT